MTSSQLRLTDLPLKEKDAELIAEETLLAEVGSTPHLGRAREVGTEFVFDVEVSFPRVIWNEDGQEARKTRFISVGKVGEIVVDRNKGRVLSRPRVFDVQRAIREKLDFVSESVEKALVRVAADKFATLPFPMHLHTPVLDVLSWLLIRDTIQLGDLDFVPLDSKQKLTATLEPLSRVGLIEVQGEVVTAGPVLIGIETQYSNAPEQLSRALSHFFREGYQFIDTVRQVLGTHLTVSSVVYEKAEETGEVVPLSLDQIENEFRRFYPPDKRTKLPRYLVQLEAIGLTHRQVRSGVSLWSAVPEIYERMTHDQLLEPVAALFSPLARAA
jgi:hypothetical protein